MSIDYQMCKRCVMDTTAEEIYFDENGVCNFCRYFDRNVYPVLERVQSEEGGKKLFHQAIKNIKKNDKNKHYDSILGLSGGVDSSYLAYVAVNSGLHPLAVHVDMGWNSEISEHNVKNIVSKLKLDLKTIKVNFEEMRDLQMAFYKAAVKNCEIPQDHAFLAALYRVADEYGIQYILTGGNLATESILPKSWGYNAGDLFHLLSIHKKFGMRKLNEYPMLSFWKRYFYYPLFKGIKKIRLLNYILYNKSKAKDFLIKEFELQDYGSKHCESVLTRFFQGYYLPVKFGIDKRKAHLSSLILSEQITREETLRELSKSPYINENQLKEDKEYIAKKLGLSIQEWETILTLPPHNHNEFPSSKILFALKDIFVKLTGIRQRNYGL